MKMTNEEIKEVLDAFDDKGYESIQWKSSSYGWTENLINDKVSLLREISLGDEYRVKPEQKKIELYTNFSASEGIMDWATRHKEEIDTHKISYLLDENNEPICESVKLEKL